MMDSAAAVIEVRLKLDLTQVQLASLLGVHPLTVSKWERGLLSPTPYQSAILDSFKLAGERNPKAGETAIKLLVGAGVAVALYFLLKAALEK
ncbi:MAG: helix-turn-helix domain-containing protein [Planctomycetota bacterium]